MGRVCTGVENRPGGAGRPGAGQAFGIGGRWGNTADCRGAASIAEGVPCGGGGPGGRLDNAPNGPICGRTVPAMGGRAAGTKCVTP